MVEARQPPPTMQPSVAEETESSAMGMPTEAELVLLCLDYLRDLRRAYSPDELRQAEGLNADYISVAIYSLSRALAAPPVLHHTSTHGNDPWMDRTLVDEGCFPKEPCSDCNPSLFPSVEDMNKEFLYSSNPHDEEAKEGEDPYSWYDYDDSHPSNAHRFYLLNGLASGPALHGPLMLGELAAAGLTHLRARSRQDAEQDMIASPLFEQFVQAVKSKGFFKDTEHETPKPDPEEEEQRLMRQRQVYEERFAKVVSKFRTKLASKAQAEGMESSIAEFQQSRRIRRRDQIRSSKLSEAPPLSEVPSLMMSESKSVISKPSPTSGQPSSPSHNPVDLEEAERLKTLGNSHMQKKEYEQAAQAYTKALKLSPSGPQSHVYFSNRAAALLSMKKFSDAILDSERSLALKPNYGKAHARLGLAHFLLGDYRQAMEAYTVALKYEPDNKSSKSYLEKAAKRLASMDSDPMYQGISPSFSVVSEWDRSARKPQTSSIPDETPEDQSLREAEKHKVKGNSFMANKEYQLALDAYSAAIAISPKGPQSHVYYSNRAAALCYLERYKEAEQDSEKSLALKPAYGKAHARLGLSRFFLNDYAGAVKAYTAALQYDPDNAASKSYLAKAKLKLERHRSEQKSDEKTRKLLEDPDMQLMAKKAMKNPSAELLEDPEMQAIAKKALSDPTVMDAVMAVQHVHHK